MSKDRLALLGGDPAVTLDQEEARRWPIVEPEALEAVQRVLEGGRWSHHEIRDSLEEEFAAYIGVEHALAHNNGTAALHACTFALDLGPGDEVISPSATYWGTAMPVLNVGAIPVFAEVDPVHLNLDPEDAEKKITPRTKAIMLCHWGGMPCDMDAFSALAREHGLKLIEDASHAHGASYRGRMIGAWGDVAGFSMQSSKLVPSGEGGMFVTDEKEYFDRAVLLGHYERLRDLDEDGVGRFQQAGYGFKYRISPLNAAVAAVSLRKLDERNGQRNGGIDYMYEQLGEIPGVSEPQIPDYVDRVYYTPPRLLYEPAELGGLPVDRFVEALQAEGADVTGGTTLRHRGGLHTQPMFVEKAHWAFEHPANAETMSNIEYGEGTLPAAEDPLVNVVSLPRIPRPTDELLDQYVEAFRKVAVNAGELV